ncbi:MAG: ribosome small subunit-dependent GTPase A [Myxococcota bacterium]
MNLDDLGWTPRLSEAFRASGHSHLDPERLGRIGRIGRIDGARATAWTRAGPVRIGLPSRLYRGGQAPVVGDWVAIESLDDGSARAIRLLPRTTHLARRAAGRRVRRQWLAANIDVVFIVSSMDEDLSERRLERYLTVVYDGGARPVILLTKAGLVDDPGPYLDRARGVAPGVDVHAIDVVSGVDPERPRTYLTRGCTAVLVGSSGVGKSTLLNHLVGAETMATRHVRASDGLGQHTTTHRELFVLATGGVVIDTPGLRELSPWADTESLDEAFGEIDDLARGCRFGDCSHRHEPGCAVREAVATGTLDEARLRSYLDLRQELAVQEVRSSEHERRKRDRALGRIYRQVQAHKRRRR